MIPTNDSRVLAQGVASLEQQVRAYAYQRDKMTEMAMASEAKANAIVRALVGFVMQNARPLKLAKAFQALTPGRRRGYALHIGGAKQSKTRASRVEKCVDRILEGKGFNER